MICPADRVRRPTRPKCVGCLRPTRAAILLATNSWNSRHSSRRPSSDEFKLRIKSKKDLGKSLVRLPSILPYCSRQVAVAFVYAPRSFLESYRG